MTKEEQEAKLSLAVDNGKKILDSLGIKYGRIFSTKVNRRASWWGQCSLVRHVSDWNDCSFEIQVSERLLQDDTPEYALMNTVIHELLHTVKNGMGHKGVWKKYATLVNEKTDYHITRLNTAHEYGVKKDAFYKYSVNCAKCGNIANYTRWTKHLQNIEYCRCRKCKGKDLKIIVNF